MPTSRKFKLTLRLRESPISDSIKVAKSRGLSSSIGRRPEGDKQPITSHRFAESTVEDRLDRVFMLIFSSLVELHPNAMRHDAR